MKTINIPIFWKFAFTIILVVFIFGSINLYILWRSVYRSFEKEIEKRSVVLSSIISEKILSPIVYDDIITINNVLVEMQRSDTSIAYIFVTDINGQVLAKSFSLKIPISLIEANAIQAGSYNIQVIKTKNYSHSTIRDIAYPILNGDIGTVRLGLVEDTIRSEITEATKLLLIMIL